MSSTKKSPTTSSNSPNDPAKVTIVSDWILAGMRLSQITEHIEKLGDKWPGPPPSQTELLDMIEEAHRSIESDAQVDPDRENAKAIARLNFLYSKCCAIQDYKGAAGIQKEINAVVARVTNARILNANA